MCNTDGGHGRTPLSDSGGGYGLTGMRERAALIGGKLDTGPVAVDPDGEKAVPGMATVPRTAPSGW